MHPLISAYIWLKGWDEIQPRSHGIYYGPWLQRRQNHLDFIKELQEYHGNCNIG